MSKDRDLKLWHDCGFSAGMIMERERLKAAIDHLMNNLLVETKPNHDDSITGINEAWDLVRNVFAESLPIERENIPAAQTRIALAEEQQQAIDAASLNPDLPFVRKLLTIIAAHTHSAPPALTDAGATEGDIFAGYVCRDVAELPNRTSPEDAPDMMLVTADELTDIILHHLPSSASTGLTSEEQDVVDVADGYADDPRIHPASDIVRDLRAIITRLTS